MHKIYVDTLFSHWDYEKEERKIVFVSGISSAVIKYSFINFTFFPLIVFQPLQHYSSSAPGPNTASSTSPSTPPLPTDDCQCPPHVMAQVWVRNGRGMQDSKSLDEISQACGGKSKSSLVSVYFGPCFGASSSSIPKKSFF